MDLWSGQLGSVRSTSEEPRRVSVIDVIQAVTESSWAKDVWRDLKASHPEVEELVHFHQFRGRGQRPTPTATLADARTIAVKALCVARVPIAIKRQRMAQLGFDVGADHELEIKRVPEAESIHPLSVILRGLPANDAVPDRAVPH